VLIDVGLAVCPLRSDPVAAGWVVAGGWAWQPALVRDNEAAGYAAYERIIAADGFIGSECGLEGGLTT